MLHRMLITLGLAALAMALATLPALACSASVDNQDMCRFFTVYKPEGTPENPEVLKRMGVTDPTAPVRSYALIVSVNDYPNFDAEHRTLAPAKNDLVNLQKFFKDQDFDEVITLENADATADNIRYFLGNYLLRESDAHQNLTRVVFAYTGHGAGGSRPGAPGSLVLGSAFSGSDPAGTMKLKEVQALLSSLADSSFHLLALIGSCYSGGIFNGIVSDGNNLFFPRAPGAHALSATAADDLAYGLNDQSGSLFFDSLINGVNSGWADPVYAGLASSESGGTYMRGGGIARLSNVAAWISGRLDTERNPVTGKPFPQIKIGSIESANPADGAFFFLVPQKPILVASLLVGPDDPGPGGDGDGPGKVDVALTDIDTGSAIQSRPDVKVFSSPDSYSVFGIDISHFSDVSDWDKVKDAGVTFAYMKSTEGGDNVDPKFKRHWKGSAAAGIVHGAYHVFNFCKPAEPQLDNLFSTVPVDDGALPVALDLNWYNGAPASASQRKCTDIESIRSEMRRWLTEVADHYGKPPIIYAHQSGVADLLGNEFNDYALWLQNWNRNDGTALPELQGRNPWTFWQYSGGGALPGVRNADFNAFFGTEEQFADFVSGKGNVARKASLVLPTAVQNSRSRVRRLLEDQPVVLIR
jgi:lysozyme